MELKRISDAENPYTDKPVIGTYERQAFFRGNIAQLEADQEKMKELFEKMKELFKEIETMNPVDEVLGGIILTPSQYRALIKRWVK